MSDNQVVCSSDTAGQSAASRSPGQETVTGQPASIEPNDNTDRPASEQPVINDKDIVKGLDTAANIMEPVSKEVDSEVEKPPQAEGPADEDPSVDPEKPMSKNQLKRLAKKQRYLEMRGQIRKKERMKRKQRYIDARANGETLGPSRKQLKHNRMKDSSCQVKVAIDCSFDDLMAEKEIKSLTKQIQSSYSANRRAENPLQFYVTSLGDKTKERLESMGEYLSWDVLYESQDYIAAFGKENVVYLSSESENVLTDLDTEKAYIIGGLVDHNSQKGLCLREAEKKGIAHAQLPIGEYLDMKTRKILAVNHVFEILLRFTECKSWKEAFLKVIPQRKGAKTKEETESEEVT